MSQTAYSEVPPAEPQFDLPPEEEPPPPLPPRPTFGRFMIWLGAGLVVALVATLAGALVTGEPLYLFDDLKGKTGAFQGGMTAITAGLLAAAAGFLAIAAQELKANGGPGERRLLAFAACVAFLAFDDLVMVHEWVAQKLATAGVDKPGNLDQDVYVFVVYAVVALALGAATLSVVWRHRRALPPLLFGGLFLLASQLCDAVPWDGLAQDQQRWLGPLEEGLKFLGALSLALFGHALQREIRVAARPW